MTMHEATVVRWLRGVGEHVEEGEPIAVLETDKATVELEAPQAGVLATIDVEPGATVAVTERLAVIDADTPPRGPGGAT
jgi:2-oxoisovalerate dehydrogenase E1 component